MTAFTPETALSLLRDVGNAALDLLYPPRCVICRQFGSEYLCAACLANAIAPINDPMCLRCGHPRQGTPCDHCRNRPPQYQRARAVSKYDGTMRDIVHFFKYRDKPMLAGVLAQAMAEYAVANRRALNELEFDMIVPVPMYPPKERRRGYNQARRLAEGIGRRLSICIADRSTLRRTRDAKPQMELPREARLVNVKGVYEAAASVSGLTVLLIDDVSTTGATLKECSATLKAAGAAKVYCLTLAAG